jgi:hypothetical protein
MSKNFDFSDVYSGLKDFQRATVDYVFRRFFEDEDTARRFLVADEVGLGKTLVARGLIARIAEHLDRQGIKRIDVVYICSNTEIARQNIRRLSLPGFREAAFASRLTLLPMKTTGLGESRLNFISFTPGTALDLKSRLGIADERALLYLLLKRKWPDLVGTKQGPMRVFQGGMGSLKRFKEHFDYLRRNALKKVDPLIEARFREALDGHKIGGLSVRDYYADLCQQWAYKGANNSPEARHARDIFIGELRTLLARTCVDALEPDLVILDEFQRFSHILHDESEASELAHALFDFSDAKVLLLSATPYKLYSLRDEGGDDHYTDFLQTVEFLTYGNTGNLQKDLAEFSRELANLDPDNLDPLLLPKDRIEDALSCVMCRTERLASRTDRNGMLTEKAPDRSPIQPEDLLSFVALDRIATELKSQSMLEHWKSASYFPNFWDDYDAGRRFARATIEEPALAAAVRSHLTDGACTLPWEEIRRYQLIDPGNTRLRSVASQLFENGADQLLWLPPSIPYYPMTGTFQRARDADLTKRLIFSAWLAVPRVISSVLSYEAERRLMTSVDRKGLENTPEGRSRFTEPLRFPRKRNSGMSAFAFIYPSLSLAELSDPLNLAKELVAGGQKVTRRKILTLAETRIMRALESILIETTEAVEGTTDDRWYWIAPLLLDVARESQSDWFWQPNIFEAWTGEGVDGGEGFDNHILESANTFDAAMEHSLRLGAPPQDLGRVLALLALGGPANCALRSLQRLAAKDGPASVAMLNAAARIAWGFRSLYNTPESTQLLRSLYKTGPYWQKALKYGVNGCLQATLDEYLHVLKEFEGIVGDLGDEDLSKLANAVEEVVSLRSSDLQAHDPLDESESTRRMRVRFALPFGQYRSEDGSHSRRSGYVRGAFNSPFWPFVLTTTSIGQEGLDFHLYCHAVVHWNLPANPVDLEQREGRVHRYMGHALRKNLARAHSKAVFNGSSPNPWQSMLDEAVAQRLEGESDLVPYWIYQGPSRIERHVPRVPLSREEGRLADLKRALVLYRLVFGQPRQEELVEMLGQMGLPDDQVDSLVDKLRIDLTPDLHTPETNCS